MCCVCALSANRDRLASLFGVCLDPLTSARPDVLARLCAEYVAAAGGADGSGTERVGWRVARRVDGTVVPGALLLPLRYVSIRATSWRLVQRLTSMPCSRCSVDDHAGGVLIRILY